MSEDAARTGPDVLDSGVRRRRWSWLLAAILVVASAVWLQGRGPEPGDLPRPAEQAGRWVAVGQPDRPATTHDRVEQLTFVDQRSGFLLQHLCSSSQGEPCPRRLAATTDGGRSWQPRARLPEQAQFLDTMVVMSASEVALLAGYLPSTIAHSGDGGRSWSVSALSRGTPRPAPAGAPLVVDAALPCPVTVCPPWLAWVDLAEQRLHRLPGQPASDETSALVAAPRGPNGELLATAADEDAGWVWTSRDNGRSFEEARLPVHLAPDQAIWGVRAFAAGGGRAYAFVKVAAADTPAVVSGFRSDDGGRTWAGLGVRLDMPAGVLAGELIGTDSPGLVQLSYDAGRHWQPSGIQVGSGSVTQQSTGGPVLATVVDGSGLATYYQSSDGRSWSRVVPPAVA
ncbi:MAG: hypothetical protein H0T66_10565 [Geodermatophilaceae bacterium]|nr:hypothetical protein [Geodermatophilaceae bacterium]